MNLPCSCGHMLSAHGQDGNGHRPCISISGCSCEDFREAEPRTAHSQETIDAWLIFQLKLFAFAAENCPVRREHVVSPTIVIVTHGLKLACELLPDCPDLKGEISYGALLHDSVSPIPRSK